MHVTGSVLGIDVGFSKRRKTTGLCLISWDRDALTWCTTSVGTTRDTRSRALEELVGKRTLSAMAIDGPLRPNLVFDPSSYRVVDAVLSRGIFQKRGKPGPTNGGSGPELHRHAIQLAKLAVNQHRVLSSHFLPTVHAKLVVEAFPNLFLGFLLDEQDYPRRPLKARKWTDTLVQKPQVQMKIQSIIELLLPGRAQKQQLQELNGHENIAAFTWRLSRS